MKQHILNQDPFNNHRSQLIQFIIEPYILLKLNHIAKMHCFQWQAKMCDINKPKLFYLKISNIFNIYVVTIIHNIFLFSTFLVIKLH
jgi:hypothetical protein